MRGVKFIEEREEAIKLRKRGFSVRKIAKKLSISRSTVSCWMKGVSLTTAQKEKLYNDWQNGLISARKKAVAWHNAQKVNRLNKAKLESDSVLANINIGDRFIQDLALAFLYFGEGFKRSEQTGMGNSDPLILKTFLFILRNNYNVPDEKLYCSLHLRADQDGVAMKKYWSNELQIPIEKFKYVNFDKRTIGSKTFVGYHGVCTISCANVAIQRKLINISRDFCERLLKRV